MEMDYAVLHAYGWKDIQLKHGFYELEYLPEHDRVRFTIDPNARKELLARLLKLNHQIHLQETIAPSLGTQKKGKKKAMHEESGKLF